MTSRKVDIQFLSHRDSETTEIKDPSVVETSDGYIMYASVGTSVTQQWVIGRFEASSPAGPWREIEEARIENVAGNEVCAPAVVHENNEWVMYVQTTCFSPGGIIARATSKDGIHFKGDDKPLFSISDVPASIAPAPVIGLYDAGVSDYVEKDVARECMIFSGYRRIGCGDIYMSTRRKGEDQWSIPHLALCQEDVPFHNKPDYKDFEWGLEGGKLVQLADDAFVMICVCFLEKDHSHRGTRQRVFLAASSSAEGPFKAMEMPYEPTLYPSGQGENGHPDTIDLGAKLGILYQERAGDGQPWHLRYAEMDKQELTQKVRTTLDNKSITRNPGKKSLGL